ncbi:DUF6153 family protein [Streptomyces coeruleoprunus]|uniref:DUF6153 family protein n=1 Tax=Streptomyces coeruleoprunus TaxID=285563 RepID=A0ABV9X657_9ACTN
MARGRCARGARYGQLLLLVALLLGIVTMHTWGHPSEHAGTHTVAAPAHGSEHPAAAHGVRAPDTPEDAPNGGMDAATVCLAVLGSLGFALGGAAALRLLRRRRRSDALAGRADRAGRVLRPQWPDPPPLRVTLAGLSVLRI